MVRGPMLFPNIYYYNQGDSNKAEECYLKATEIDNKLYVNAVAYRKTHLINMGCFKTSLTWWNCDIYARTHHKTAIYTILKCGFKKIGENLYIYKR